MKIWLLPALADRAEAERAEAERKLADKPVGNIIPSCQTH
jgi:hypothetical protein